MRKKVALLAGIATLALTGTALAVAGNYYTGTYVGSTSQGHGIAMVVGRGYMKGMAYYANFRCVDKQGNGYTLKNHKQTLGRASINSYGVINAVYSKPSYSVHLYVALHNLKASGWFKEALVVYYHNRQLHCYTPGGHATTAGKVFFSMHHR